MTRSPHPLATPDNALAWIASGQGIFQFMEETLGVVDVQERSQLAFQLRFLTAQERNPAITEWIEKLGTDGHTLKVRWSPDDCEVSILNPRRPEKDDRRVGVLHSYIGHARFLFEVNQTIYKIEYEFLRTPATKALLGNQRETKSMDAFLKKAASELAVPTEGEVARAQERHRQKNAEGRAMRARNRMRELARNHGMRALEILADSNVPVPEDFKAVMGEYLDLAVTEQQARKKSHQPQEGPQGPALE